MSKIGYTKNYIPSKKISVKEYFNEYTENSSDEKVKAFLKDTGLKDISIEERSVIDALSVAIEEYLDAVKPDLNKIKYIFFTDIKNLRDSNGKYIPYYLQAKYKMLNANVIVISQYCAGSIFAMAIADKMVEDDEIALILSSSKIHDMKDRYIGYTIQGDAAGIMEIKNCDSPYKIEASHCTTKLGYGEFAENMLKDRLSLVKKGIHTINDLINKSQVKKEDIDFVIPQNVSRTAYTTIYSSLLGINKEKFFLENIDVGGHLCDVDALFNLKTCIERNKDAENLILYGIGEVGDNFCINSVLVKKE